MQNQMHRIDSQHLEFLASTTLLTTIEKIRRIQYLTGTLHSRKRAYWYGYCNTDICPNCKSSKDGGSHIMSACPAISTSYLSRHHALGRIIGKSVSQGNLGNSLEFCFTDLGSQDKKAVGAATSNTRRSLLRRASAAFSHCPRLGDLAPRPCSRLCKSAKSSLRIALESHRSSARNPRMSGQLSPLWSRLWSFLCTMLSNIPSYPHVVYDRSNAYLV